MYWLSCTYVQRWNLTFEGVRLTRGMVLRKKKWYSQICDLSNMEMQVRVLQILRSTMSQRKSYLRNKKLSRDALEIKLSMITWTSGMSLRYWNLTKIPPKFGRWAAQWHADVTYAIITTRAWDDDLPNGFRSSNLAIDTTRTWRMWACPVAFRPWLLAITSAVLVLLFNIDVFLFSKD